VPRILDLPPASRPRERMLAQHAHLMRPEELLALVLGTGRGSGEDALQLAERVLAELSGVEGLAAADTDQLQTVVGIGPVKATRIRAAFELALRAGPVEPLMEPELMEPDPFHSDVERLRACIPIGERAVLGFDPTGQVSIISLALGEPLGTACRPGAFLAQLLSAGPGPWWIISVRPDGPPEPDELAAAQRLLEAAALVGVPIEHVFAIGRTAFWTLDEATP
jgi:DNA repair protein RadC